MVMQTVLKASKDILPYDSRITLAQAWQESRFSHDAVSHAGAKGVMQLLDDTFERMLPGGDIFCVADNVFAGCKYMQWLYKQWSSPRPEMDRIFLALASYNAGLGNLLEAQKLSGNKSSYAEIAAYLPDVTGDHSVETLCYVRFIMQKYIKYVDCGAGE